MLDRKTEQCCQCESKMEGPPVVLPCQDVVCTRCLHDMRALGDTDCPKCHQEIPEDFIPATDRRYMWVAVFRNSVEI
jgi:hypothetical protein